MRNHIACWLCQEFAEDFRACFLSEKEMTFIQTHIDNCPQCKCEFSELAKINDILTQAKTELQNFPEELGTKLQIMDNIAGSKLGSMLEMQWLRNPAMAGITLCAVSTVVAIVIAFAVGNPTIDPQCIRFLYFH